MTEEREDNGAVSTASETDQAGAGEYSIGYGRPPLHTRFRPGESGNPRGRPKGQQNAKSIVKKVLDEPVTVREGEKTRKASKFEALVQANVLKAMKGDPRASAFVITLLTRTGQLAEADVDTASADLATDDEAIIREWRRRNETPTE